MILAGDEMALAAESGECRLPAAQQLTLENPQGEPIAQTTGPVAGEVWAEPRLLALLNASVGDVLEVGPQPVAA